MTELTKQTLIALPAASDINLDRLGTLADDIPQELGRGFKLSMNPLDDLSPFTASSVLTSALHISAARFLNAMIAWLRVAPHRALAITKQVDEAHHSINCPRFSNSFLQRDTAHDVPMPVCVHHNARY